MAAKSLKCFQRDCLKVSILDGQSKCCLLPLKKDLRKLGNKTAATITKHSQYGSHQDKEAIKNKKTYLKAMIESK